MFFTFCNNAACENLESTSSAVSVYEERKGNQRLYGMSESILPAT